MMLSKRNDARIEAWTLDQFAKSTFFHRKLHEWKLLEMADQIDQVRGENLNWDNLNISEAAWNKIIHRGIKPVVAFAHPHVLRTVPGSVRYYRMLAMVSQKSMKRVGFDLDDYEMGKSFLDDEVATAIAHHLNLVISALIDADEVIDSREFELWRGMAAGSQAQGSWQNNKGNSAEMIVREVILKRLQGLQIISGAQINATRIALGDSRILVFADEPDVAVYQNDIPLAAVEIKGGIDPAGVLERIGAALKSLQRIKQQNPDSVTLLILQDVSITQRALSDLNLSAGIVTRLFSIEAIIKQEAEREKFFEVLGIPGS